MAALMPRDSIICSPDAQENLLRMNDTNRHSVLRWTRQVCIVLVVFAAWASTFQFFERKFGQSTGTAEWIWEKHKLSSEIPVVFFATKEFEVPADRQFVKIKAAGDPEFVLYFNGVEIGGNTEQVRPRLEVYDVTALSRIGRGNRLVAAVRSGNGVGGLLISVDFSPTRQNAVVTDRSWKLLDEWNDALLSNDVEGLKSAAIVSLGRPPFGRWNYLMARERPLAAAASRVMQPVTSSSFQAPLREIRVINGVAVASTVRVPAVIFDFGSVKGRGRIEIDAAHETLVRVRYANDRAELEAGGDLHPFVFAKGEKVVTDPRVREFRFMAVYMRAARASVLEVK